MSERNVTGRYGRPSVHRNRYDVIFRYLLSDLTFKILAYVASVVVVEALLTVSLH